MSNEPTAIVNDNKNMQEFILVFHSILSKYSSVCLRNGHYHFSTSFPVSSVTRIQPINRFREIIIALDHLRKAA